MNTASEGTAAPNPKPEKRWMQLGGMIGDAFGNPWVQVEGPFADDFSKLPWQYEDHWSGEKAIYRAAGFELYVKDYDGDSAGWKIKRHGATVATGETREFFEALGQCDAALREAVRARLKAIRCRRFSPIVEITSATPVKRRHMRARRD